MRKKFVLYIVGILILSLAFSFFYLQEPKADGETHILTEEEQKELVEFNDSLIKGGGFFSLVGEELSKAGYKYQTAGMIYSMDDIRIYLIVPDSEVITDKTKKEINNIYQDMVSKHNLNWEAFMIKVAHSDEIE
ncbi:hypothetical protein [Sporosarcina sp. BP05]|uniref:hypothetical protein n=1 Tax=Sporosarcina sp. BP05 TaxID=2758726 RepID=UPI0016455C1C|nr:hypothetical protein [Sporosarcina sp. BP05]